MQFVHESLPQRVRFGAGQAAQGVWAEVGLLGGSRAMVIAAPEESDVAKQITEGIAVVLHHDEVAMHVPIEVAQRARRAAEASDADLLVCIGGGSTTGLAKAVALTTQLPIVAVPTTYAGSEATPVWGLTEGLHKNTGTSRLVLPRSIVYDAALTVSLPVEMSIASGLNAMAHCIDSLWAPSADPITNAMASEGIWALNLGLRAIVADPTALPGREQTLYGAYLAARSFASAGAGLHHKICHVLGGKYGLPHAQTHATVLPYVVALNASHAPHATKRLAAALGSSSAIAGLQSLRSAVGGPQALRDYGFTEDQIPAAVEAIMPFVPASNPAPVTRDVLAAVLRSAWQGSDPQW